MLVDRYAFPVRARRETTERTVGTTEGARTKLELSGPHRLWGVGHEVLGEVTLHAADHVVTPGFSALADDAERVVFHDRGPADPPEKALLHPTFELEDGDFGRRLNWAPVSIAARTRGEEPGEVGAQLTSSTSTETSRSVTQGMRTLRIIG